MVAAGSFGRTVELWVASSDNCMRTLRAERRYERLDITGLTGITDQGQIDAQGIGRADVTWRLIRPTSQRVSRAAGGISSASESSKLIHDGSAGSTTVKRAPP
jgi:hypothetical protein